MIGRRLSPVFVLSFVSMVNLRETVAQFPLVVDLMLGPSHVRPEGSWPPPLKNLPKNPACQLPTVTGPCYVNFPSFYFDSQQQRCLPFTYGGCNGNSNRFRSLEECEAACPLDPPNGWLCSRGCEKSAMLFESGNSSCDPIYSEDGCCITEYKCRRKYEQEDCSESSCTTFNPKTKPGLVCTLLSDGCCVAGSMCYEGPV